MAILSGTEVSSMARRALRRWGVIGACLLTTAATNHSAPITIWLAGDSTMAAKLPTRRPETGWGEMLGQYFRPEEVRIANRAQNGRSTKTFISEGRWQQLVDSLRPGDYVFVQFGHNDESVSKGDRYTPPDEFRRNLTRMAGDVRTRGGHPVLFTPVRRRKFDASGRLADTHGEYPSYTIAVVHALDVPLIDMHASSARVLASYGADSSAKLFLHLAPGEHPTYPAGVDDDTHFRPLGAELMARAAVEGIVEQLPALAAHLHSAQRWQAHGSRRRSPRFPAGHHDAHVPSPPRHRRTGSSPPDG